MRVGMIGLGKLGLPVALAIESRGHEVFGYDTNALVKDYLKDERIPFREEGIESLLVGNQITWCDSVKEVVEKADLVFVSIQTPHDPRYEGASRLPAERKDFDYSYLQAGLDQVAEACMDKRLSTMVAVISTCLPGTFKRLLRPLITEYVEYVYTPQFIAMGTVIEDYLNPEFNLIGAENKMVADRLEEFYKTINDAPMVKTDITTAEGIKLSYNTWITAKTVVANAWGELSDRLGMNFDDIRTAWEYSDRRLLSDRYMDAGMSDGGGCHPRDNIAMSWLSEQVGQSHNLWEDLMLAREDFELWHAQKFAEYGQKNPELPLVLLGKAFKPETDIETGSPARLMADLLDELGVDYAHINDLENPEPAVYFIATQNDRYCYYVYPSGSTIIDPFGYMPDFHDENVTVIKLGRRPK